MSARALILTYHAVERREGPLFTTPALLTEHLDVIRESGADVVGVSELASRLRIGPLERPTVVVTFDDAAASVTRVAAPMLEERGLTATVFCVAGHVGERNDWPSARPGAPSIELATAPELAELARRGWEIGAHGMTHAPLIGDDDAGLACELVDARALLEDTLDTRVDSLAYPYGAPPSRAARLIVEDTYTAAVTTSPRTIVGDFDPWALPRVDAHYFRAPRHLALALHGRKDRYLCVRGLGARARRRVRADYLPGGTTFAAKGHAT